MLFAAGWFAMLIGLGWFFRAAALRAPLARAARPQAFELIPARYLPLGVAALAAMVASIR